MHFYLQQGLAKQKIHRKKNMEEAGSGRASPDLGQIWPSRLAGQPGVAEAVWARPSHPIRRGSMAGHRRHRRLLHAHERDNVG
jgi:hypothetical protein